MARILGPLQRRVVESGTLTASTLTAVDVDFGLDSLGAVLIHAIDGSWEPSSLTNADDRMSALILRPDYAVVSATDVGEPWSDPDFYMGKWIRDAFSTNGGLQAIHSFYLQSVQGVLLARRASALFFDDNAIANTLGIWYQRVILSESDLVNLVIAGRR